MKKRHTLKNGAFMFLCAFLSFMLAYSSASAQAKVPLRRPISPEQPMWIIHIDTWNYADPQKIIDLVPNDIRPFVVMDISLSISHTVATSQFQVAEYGYEIAKSWVRTCAQNQMWCVVQCSSGGYSQFSDFDLTVYEEFYRDYPNFLGFNYAEQFWGYDDPSDPLSPKWTDRMAHFANLLELSNRYGGYLIVSWCGNQWSPSINPIAMMKRNPAFAAACRNYTENYILCEKYTQQSYQSDMESVCLGAYLSGYSGQYGCRYDDTGWTNSAGVNENFTMATAGAVNLEHIMLTGQTVLDGPELIWTQCFKETARKSTTDGYMKRDWETFPQFMNVSVDVFRKVIDGTVRIPSRQEVIDRTKFVVITDINNSNVNDTYSSPQTMFEGLYRMDGDGNYENNKTFFKKTGRYPTIPTVYKLDDAVANSFQYKVNKSVYATRWPSIASKVTEFSTLFPEEYTGDLYAGRHENGWVIYNPYKTGINASGSIPFKYNTCERVDLNYSQYTASVMKEYSDKVTFYLSNYDNVINTGLKTDVIKIYGSSSEPTFSYIERGNHQASVIVKDWTDGVFTLTVQHNGALDVAVNCAGTATGRLTSYTSSHVVAPAKPSVYTGSRQYEAECFDYKSIAGITTGGQNGTIRNYTGQGYLKMGFNSSASVRDTVYALRSGAYDLITKYSSSVGDVSAFDLYVNGVKVATPLFAKTANESTWNYNVQKVVLTAGKNVIVFKANASASYGLTLDNIVITQGNNNGIYHFENDIAATAATTPAAELVTIKGGSAGVVVHTGADGKLSNRFKSYSVGATNATGVADLDMFPVDSENYSVVWKEFDGATGAKKGVLLRGIGASAYAEGLKQGYLFIVENNANNTFTLKNYVVDVNNLIEKQSYTTSFSVAAGNPCWFRATADGEKLSFECSSDSITWVGESATTFTDATYSKGSNQLVWGLGSNDFNWVVDNIVYQASSYITATKTSLSGLNYQNTAGPSAVASFNVYGGGIDGDVLVSVGSDFEISLNSTSGYAQSISVASTNSVLPSTAVYVRMKSGLPIGTYNSIINVNCYGVPNSNAMSRTVTVAGDVFPMPVSFKYDFTNDIAGTAASVPPALNVTNGLNNTATAGVVSYTDNQSATSNCFKPYSGGQRNNTGVMDLNLFPKEATNYSVTWKQCKANVSIETKSGVLLRGDATVIGGSTTGYVEGMRQGYVFIIYTTATGSQFRIYKSTLATTLSMVANNSVAALVPTVGQPVWYRASVSGTNQVACKFEYSIDKVNWSNGATFTDSSAPFQVGSTQIVWGLATDNTYVHVDDVEFDGIANDTTTPVSEIGKNKPVIVSEEYYNLNGQRIDTRSNKPNGIYIVKILMSDGAVVSRKEFVK